MKRLFTVPLVAVLVAGFLLRGSATRAWAQTVSAPSITITTTSVVSTGITAIPGGTESFTTFHPGDPIAPPDPCISNGNLSFWGGGSGGQQGIYSSR